MTSTDRLAADSTHLFRGARLRSQEEAPTEPGEIRLRFHDGVEVAGDLEPGQEDGELILAVPAYTTAAGTGIEAKRWRIRYDAGALVVGERVR